MTKFFLFVLVIGSLIACSDNKKDTRALPDSIGGEYVIVVIVDDELENAPHVIALKEVLTKPYPMLNQIEPWFTISWIDVDNVNYLTEKNRNLILLTNRDAFGKVRQMGRSIFGDEAIDKLEADQNQSMIMGIDAFTRPQHIMYLAAENAEDLADFIKNNQDKILNYFETKEFERIHQNLFQYNKRVDLQNQLSTELGYTFNIPEIYEPALLGKENLLEIYEELGIEGFKWYFSKSRNGFSNVTTWAMPYKDSVQLRLANIIAARDSVLKRFVPCEDEGSFMGTEIRFKDVRPTKEIVTLNGNYAVRITGFWRAINGFQGGPFVSYVVVDEKNGRLIFVDGSVAAKGQPKKKFIVRLKAILSTLKIL